MLQPKSSKRTHYAIQLISNRYKQVIICFVLIIPLLLSAQVKGVKHVILIGVDGMGANYLSKAQNIPVMQSIMQQGVSTMHARCVQPSSSAVNWASMVMGAGPSLHGYTEWDSKKPEIPSRQIDHYGMFPTIYALLRDQQPPSKIGVIYSWSGIGYLFPKQAVNKDDHTNNDSLTADHAAKYIQAERPDFLFVHFDGVDEAGHGIGWGTNAYYQAIQGIDSYIGQIIKSVKNAGIEKNTVIIVTADHGGIKKTHGGKSIQEMEIPWMAFGPKIKRNTILNKSIMTYDTAATIAYLFGLKTPQVWIGRPVLEAVK